MRKKNINIKRNEGTISVKAVFLLMLGFIVLGVFLYLFNIKEIKQLSKEKIRMLDEIKVLQSEIDDLIIEKQKLLALERIDKISRERLGLVPNVRVNEKITIDKRELEYIKRIIDDKYE